MSKRARREVWAAGGVVYRRVDGRIEVVLVARTDEGLWALPKGKPHAGESVEETALREVAEETGLDVAIDTMNGEARRIGSISYRYGGSPDGIPRVRKEVHHFLMHALGGDIAHHDAEHDLVGWYDIHEAAKRMTYSNERSIVERAGALIADGVAAP
ncbi:MAG: NUDIX hydrolase [Chloroflexi bacterium]|nr:NUDIX hydrolase [Chloroflexota bacterium]